MGELKMFLTSWPHGKLRPVEVLGPNSRIRAGIYIKYLDEKGGTDTTTSDFLFDMPDLTSPADKVAELILAVEDMTNGCDGDCSLMMTSEYKRVDEAIAQLQSNGTGGSK